MKTDQGDAFTSQGIPKVARKPEEVRREVLNRLSGSPQKN